MSSSVNNLVNKHNKQVLYMTGVCSNLTDKMIQIISSFFLKCRSVGSNFIMHSAINTELYSRFWLSCLGPLLYCSQNFNLFDFRIFLFWAYLMTIIPETRRVH